MGDDRDEFLAALCHRLTLTIKERLVPRIQSLEEKVAASLRPRKPDPRYGQDLPQGPAFGYGQERPEPQYRERVYRDFGDGYQYQNREWNARPRPSSYQPQRSPRTDPSCRDIPSAYAPPSLSSYRALRRYMGSPAVQKVQTTPDQNAHRQQPLESNVRRDPAPAARTAISTAAAATNVPPTREVTIKEVIREFNREVVREFNAEKHQEKTTTDEPEQASTEEDPNYGLDGDGSLRYRSTTGEKVCLPVGMVKTALQVAHDALGKAATVGWVVLPVILHARDAAYHEDKALQSTCKRLKASTEEDPNYSDRDAACGSGGGTDREADRAPMVDGTAGEPRGEG
jgi:hypothetical protein